MITAATPAAATNAGDNPGPPIMATTKLQKETAAAAASTELVEQQTGALATMNDDMFAADAGSGMEGATSESFAIPFLSILQKGSPQVDEASGVAIDGAKAGMLFENVTGRMIPAIAGQGAGVLVVPCAYKRQFLHWGPRSGAGAGFRGEVSAERLAQMRAAGQVVEVEGKLLVPLPDGNLNPKLCGRISDTRSHFVLIVDEETGAWTQALMSLSSTQIKKSKALMSMLAAVKVKGPNGLFTPPTFANMVRVNTVAEKNDEGTWYGWRFEIASRVNRSDLYAAAKAFHQSVAQGSVEVRYTDDAAAAPTGSSGVSGADVPF